MLPISAGEFWVCALFGRAFIAILHLPSAVCLSTSSFGILSQARRHHRVSCRKCHKTRWPIPQDLLPPVATKASSAGAPRRCVSNMGGLHTSRGNAIRKSLTQKSANQDLNSQHDQFSTNSSVMTHRISMTPSNARAVTFVSTRKRCCERER